MNKKAISGIVVTSLLIVVSVVSVIGFQSWFNDYSSEVFINSEEDSSLNQISLGGVYGDSLYLESSNSRAIDMFQIQDFSGNTKCSFTKASFQNFTSKTVLLLDMDHKNSTHIFDLSGYENHGEYFGINCSINGIYSKSCYFNGTEDSYIDVKNLYNLSFPQEKGTISLWIKFLFFQDNPSGNYVFDRFGGNRNHIFFRDYNNSFGNFQISLQNTTPAYSASWVPNTSKLDWQHIVLVYDTNENWAKYYLQGNLLEKDSEMNGRYTDLDWTPNEQQVIFGTRNLYDSLDGFLDEIAIYNTTLNNDEVKFLYKNKKVIKYEQILSKGVKKIDISSCNLDKGLNYKLTIFGDNFNIQTEFIKK